MRWKALAEIYTMHSFAPFSSLNFFVKLLRNFRHFFHNFCYFSVIFLDFFEILLKFCRNFWKFHGNPLNLQISMNFREPRKNPGRNPAPPDCPPPRWRWGFGGRKRTLPWRGGREKHSTQQRFAVVDWLLPVDRQYRGPSAGAIIAISSNFTG